jgi:hypothetical protein
LASDYLEQDRSSFYSFPAHSQDQAPLRKRRTIATIKNIGRRMIPGSVAVLRDDGLICEMQTVEFTALDNVNSTEFAEPKR